MTTTASTPATETPATPQRSRTWETRELAAYLNDKVNSTFVWGPNDCCLFAANAILAMTGTDISSDFRGKYSDEASAFSLIKTVTGGTTVADAAAYCAAKHGLFEWVKNGKPAPLYAQRGDLVVVSNDGNIIAGIVDLSGRYVASIGQGGILRLPLSTIQRAWHI